MFISGEVLNSLQKKRELCIYIESCILQGFLKTSAVDLMKQSSILQQHNLIALHVRTGDAFAFQASATPNSKDERIPSKEIPIFFEAAKEVGKNFSKNPIYFLASDNLQVVEMAKSYFGQKLVTVDGAPAHMDLETRYNTADYWKLILDWFILSESEVVIHGPWSTFTEKALVYKHFKKKKKSYCKMCSKDLQQLFKEKCYCTVRRMELCEEYPKRRSKRTAIYLFGVSKSLCSSRMLISIDFIL
jgi:hypothetical protein